MTAADSDPALPCCVVCGDQYGPWRPTGERYRSGAQVLACRRECAPAEEILDEEE